MKLNYSDSYRAQLRSAIHESKKLGFVRPAIISPDKAVAVESLERANDVVNRVSHLLDRLLPGYWGNHCQTLASHIFAHLNARGIPANIVLGNVIINGTDEFETTLESLQDEYRAADRPQGVQNIHAWVSLGDDTIIDAALPPRLVKVYEAPAQLEDVIFIGRASEFSERFKVNYQPLLVGSEFFAKTNPPDPMELLNVVKMMVAG